MKKKTKKSKVLTLHKGVLKAPFLYFNYFTPELNVL